MQWGEESRAEIIFCMFLYGFIAHWLIRNCLDGGEKLTKMEHLICLIYRRLEAPLISQAELATEAAASHDVCTH